MSFWNYLAFSMIRWMLAIWSLVPLPFLTSGNLLYNIGSSNPVLCDNLAEWEGVGGGKEVKREGTYVYLWLIHVEVWQKPTQHCKIIVLQSKINKFLIFLVHQIIMNFILREYLSSVSTEQTFFFKANAQYPLTVVFLFYSLIWYLFWENCRLTWSCKK